MGFDCFKSSVDTLGFVAWSCWIAGGVTSNLLDSFWSWAVDFPVSSLQGKLHHVAVLESSFVQVFPRQVIVSFSALTKACNVVHSYIAQVSNAIIFSGVSKYFVRNVIKCKYNVNQSHFHTNLNDSQVFNDIYRRYQLRARIRCGRSFGTSKSTHNSSTFPPA